MTKRHGTPAAAAMVFGFGLLLAASDIHAQPNIDISAGANVYDSDAFCLNTGAFISAVEVGVNGNMVGASASAMNSDVPWFPNGGIGGAASVFSAAATVLGRGQESVYLSQGNAYQATIEILPLGVLRRLTDREGTLDAVDQRLRPFIGVGVIVTTDGDAVPAGGDRNLDTWAMKGFVAPLVAYGARLYLPSRTAPVSLLVQYRGNSAFVSGGEFETPTGTTVDVGDETLSWGTWSVGLSLRLGS